LLTASRTARSLIETVLADDGDLAARGTLDLEQTVRRLQRDVDGLLDDDVFARLEHRYGVPGVHAAGGADAYGVEIHAREHLPDSRVRGATICLGELLGQFGDDIGDGDELRGLQAGDGPRMVRTYDAASQNAEAQFFDAHVSSPPSKVLDGPPVRGALSLRR
jgi:hypothetical protein